MRVTNNFMIKYKALFHKSKHRPGTVSGQESMVKEFTGPRGEPSTVILLSRHSIKLLSEFISLYS